MEWARITQSIGSFAYLLHVRLGERVFSPLQGTDRLWATTRLVFNE
jgi:hypothetical protein